MIRIENNQNLKKPLSLNLDSEKSQIKKSGFNSNSPVSIFDQSNQKMAEKSTNIDAFNKIENESKDKIEDMKKPLNGQENNKADATSQESMINLILNLLIEILSNKQGANVAENPINNNPINQEKGGLASAVPQQGAATAASPANNNKQVSNGSAEAKVQLGAQEAKNWLAGNNNNGNSKSGTAVNNQQKEKVKQTIDKRNIPVRAGNLGNNTLGQTNGSSIIVDSKFASKSSIQSIASTVLHEMSHIAFGGGSQQNEINCEKFAEAYRDEKGIGKFNNDSSIASWAKRNYTELPKTGGHFFA